MKNLYSFVAILLPFLLLSCKTAQLPPSLNIDKSQLIVLLQKETKAKELIYAFKTFELAIKGQTSRSENKWIFTYNSDLIQAEELLQKIQASPLVIEAIFLPIKKKL